jgi:GT2 family glycosyltransferase/glycosyltransferase involved in cell wall biosynthesis
MIPMSVVSISVVPISVVIVTHNSAAVIEDCLASLTDGFGGLPTPRVVVVDNDSRDDTLALVSRVAPHAEVVATGHNGGYGAAVNTGCRRLDPGDAVLVLNPDVRLHRGAVAALAEVLRIPGTAMAVPRIVDGNDRLEPSLRRRPTAGRALGEALLGGRRAGLVGPLGEMETRPGAYGRIRRVDWATGAALLLHPRCRADVGEWDESFFLYSEETEYALRAGDRGLVVRFTPHATVTHLGGDVGRAPDLWALQTINRVRLHRRRRGRAAAGALHLALLVNEASRAALGRPTSRAGLVALLHPGSATLRRPSVAHAPASDRVGWICFSAQDWWYHNQGHSDFRLMQEVARDRTVLLVNSIGLRMPLPGRSTQPLRRITRKAASVARYVRRPLPDRPGYHVMTPVFLPAYTNPLLRALNARLVRAQVTLVARALGIRRSVCMVTLPTAWEVARDLRGVQTTVFNRSDKHSAFTELSGTHVAEAEARLLAEADVVAYPSGALQTADRAVVGTRAVRVDHGVDPDMFRPGAGPEPADLAVIARPRIGFFGGLDDYLVDFDLLEHLAASVPDAQLVLIGDATCSLDRFDRHPNVHHLGHRPYADIPRYGCGFDVALMPWLDNDWIHHSNPIKLKEYLALGLPVVSTDFPEVHRWARWIRVSRTPDEFVAQVVRTLIDGGPATPAERRAAVVEHTWTRAAAGLMARAEQAAGEA